MKGFAHDKTKLVKVPCSICGNIVERKSGLKQVRCYTCRKQYDKDYNKNLREEFKKFKQEKKNVSSKD